MGVGGVSRGISSLTCPSLSLFDLVCKCSHCLVKWMMGFFLCVCMCGCLGGWVVARSSFSVCVGRWYSFSMKVYLMELCSDLTLLLCAHVLGLFFSSFCKLHVVFIT